MGVVQQGKIVAVGRDRYRVGMGRDIDAVGMAGNLYGVAVARYGDGMGVRLVYMRAGGHKSCAAYDHIGGVDDSKEHIVFVAHFFHAMVVI